jgi:hypothetical protein
MLRTTFRGSFLLVEGDIDARLYGRLVNPDECLIQICNNRSSVICVVNILNAQHFVGHLGIIDGDFSQLLNERLPQENLLVTDENDIELTILRSDTLDRFLAEYGSREKVVALENARTQSVREILVRSASAIGTLVLLSRKHGWNLDFKEMTFRFLDRDTIEIDLNKQIEHLRGRTQGTTMPDLDAVKAAMDAVRHEHTDLIKHVRGCDICEVLGKGVHDVFGRNHHNLSRGGLAVEEVIRAAYSRENFEQTSLYAEIKRWEARNPPFIVL